MGGMIERVARAIFEDVECVAIAFGAMPMWDEVDETERDKWREAAIAAIEAMRDPTDAMHDAGSKVIIGGEGNPHDKPLPTLRNAYRAMINEAVSGVER
jgi:hypothetical protein